MPSGGTTAGRCATTVTSPPGEELLPRIAELSLPELADWSSVDLLGDSGEPRRITSPIAVKARTRSSPS
jgi:hypothetical protein